MRVISLSGVPHRKQAWLSPLCACILMQSRRGKFLFSMFRDGTSRGKVVIVGAGPAGALSAIYLAKQNYDVEVKECSARARPNDALGGYACGHEHTLRTAWACATTEFAFKDGGCSGMLMWQASTTLIVWSTTIAHSYCKVRHHHAARAGIRAEGIAGSREQELGSLLSPGHVPSRHGRCREGQPSPPHPSLTCSIMPSIMLTCSLYC